MIYIAAQGKINNNDRPAQALDGVDWVFLTQTDTNIPLPAKSWGQKHHREDAGLVGSRGFLTANGAKSLNRCSKASAILSVSDRVSVQTA